jgi:ABC-type Fe3+/spermidine/putrescine transport system ATPase subunit
MKIELKQITQKYGELTAVKDVSLAISNGEMVALLGPSGCGKTTLLRTIAGLLPLYKGTIYLDGVDISAWPAQRRNMAMVFQNYALFPHMTVAENIVYGLKVKKVPKSIQKQKLAQILSKVRLEGYSQRKIHELSGGQQQRVALARALVTEPHVLLFDEPLSNLDEKLRVSMRQEIKKIQREYGITSIYVTHDQEEAMSIADRIVIMKDGFIQQIGSPREIYFQPKSIFVADFMGIANIMAPGEIKFTPEQIEFKMLGNSYRVAAGNYHERGSLKLKIMFRPEEVEIKENGEFQGVIKWYESLGATGRMTIEIQGCTVVAETFNRSRGSREYRPGEEIRFTINPAALHLLEE